MYYAPICRAYPLPFLVVEVTANASSEYAWFALVWTQIGPKKPYINYARGRIPALYLLPTPATVEARRDRKFALRTIVCIRVECYLFDGGAQHHVPYREQLSEHFFWRPLCIKNFFPSF
jgi:hypothetical protein